jgi:hypothetical protein
VLPQYAKLKVDPRNSAPWDQALADIDEGMIKPITEANPTDPNLAKLVQRREALHNEIIAWASFSPIEKNRSQLEALVSKATDDLAKLGEDGNARSPRPRRPSLSNGKKPTPRCSQKSPPLRKTSKSGRFSRPSITNSKSSTTPMPPSTPRYPRLSPDFHQ